MAIDKIRLIERNATFELLRSVRSVRLAKDMKSHDFLRQKLQALEDSVHSPRVIGLATEDETRRRGVQVATGSFMVCFFGGRVWPLFLKVVRRNAGAFGVCGCVLGWKWWMMFCSGSLCEGVDGLCLCCSFEVWLHPCSNLKFIRELQSDGFIFASAVVFVYWSPFLGLGTNKSLNIITHNTLKEQTQTTQNPRVSPLKGHCKKKKNTIFAKDPSIKKSICQWKRCQHSASTGLKIVHGSNSTCPGEACRGNWSRLMAKTKSRYSKWEDLTETFGCWFIVLSFLVICILTTRHDLLKWAHENLTRFIRKDASNTLTKRQFTPQTLKITL